ncbi:hypothetical protein BTN50_1802 [Candidatus Enterovibrio altilux]|uniref:Uncharacterized protein n=1 Tax=Candidatus Enterovibrio altilux TaxID=1927128 RepID=A0A291BB35_9GAMM|nr:hypothetical protein BTN50_1802 [Candidatus Enterovibrio luxaltus]
MAVFFNNLSYASFNECRLTMICNRINNYLGLTVEIVSHMLEHFHKSEILSVKKYIMILNQ